MSFSVLKFGSLLSKQMSRPTNAAVLGRSVANKNTLTRRELAAVIAEEHDLSIAQSDRIIKSVFDTIVEKVADKGSVRIADFGSFDSLHVPARTYRVPNTGGTIDKPPSERPRFKAFASFKKSINK